MINSALWPIVRLATLATDAKGSIVGGPFGSDLVSRDYVSSGVPVVRGANLPKDAKFSYEDFVFVSERKADALQLNCASPGDLVFTQRGTLGQVGLIPKNSPHPRFLISQSQMKMTVDAAKADPLYLYYYFRLPSTVSYIENHALQAGVPHINLGILRRIEVICPPLRVQKKIAAILSAYDDLIENNRHRIALLEKMAEEIYREWFVRMRFPDHEKAKFTSWIPEGWNAVRIGDEIKFDKGISYSGQYLSSPDEGIPMVNLKCITVEGKFRKEGVKNYKGEHRKQHVVHQGDIVIANTDLTQSGGIIGNPALVPKIGTTRDMIFSHHLCAVRLNAQNRHRFYYYHLFRSQSFKAHALGYANGATVLGLRTEDIERFQFIKPDGDLVSRFSQIAEQHYREADLLVEANEHLEQTRNALLRRLISGKLPVDNLNIDFPLSVLSEVEEQKLEMIHA